MGFCVFCVRNTSATRGQYLALNKAWQSCYETFRTHISLRRCGRQQHNGLELPECLHRGRKCSNAIPPRLRLQGVNACR